MKPTTLNTAKNLLTFVISVLIFSSATVSVGSFEQQTFERSGATPQLIELYSSEGCHSCPPAEKWLSGFTDHKGLWTDVVPIAFHVDYWNYLGWKDRFSSREFSNRQRNYKRIGHLRSVYTPGMVVAGREWQGWFRSQPLPTGSRLQHGGRLKLKVDNNRFTIDHQPQQKRAGNAYFALLGFGIQSNVTRGENTGKKLSHDFVVLDFKALGDDQDGWQGRFNHDFDHEVSHYAAVAWVEHADSAYPLQVAGGYLE